MKFIALLTVLCLISAPVSSAEKKESKKALKKAKKSEKVVKPKKEHVVDSISEKKYMIARIKMVNDQIKARGIEDENVLKVMQEIPRHKFIPIKFITGKYARNPYGDYPVSIGEGVTISQPYIVALMTDTLELTGKEKILEVGTGSGYQAAVISKLAKSVYTIEILDKVAEMAKENLKGYKNIHIKVGDGYLGWPKHAPFDRIIVTCAPDHIPQPLVDQLAEGGKMVIPVGTTPHQLLKVAEKKDGELYSRNIIPASFVPMTGPMIGHGEGDSPEPEKKPEEKPKKKPKKGKTKKGKK